MPITDIDTGNLEVKFGTAAVRLEESHRGFKFGWN